MLGAIIESDGVQLRSYSAQHGDVVARPTLQCLRQLAHNARFTPCVGYGAVVTSSVYKVTQCYPCRALHRRARAEFVAVMMGAFSARDANAMDKRTGDLGTRCAHDVVSPIYLCLRRNHGMLASTPHLLLDDGHGFMLTRGGADNDNDNVMVSYARLS